MLRYLIVIPVVFVLFLLWRNLLLFLRLRKIPQPAEQVARARWSPDDARLPPVVRQALDEIEPGARAQGFEATDLVIARVGGDIPQFSFSCLSRRDADDMLLGAIVLAEYSDGNWIVMQALSLESIDRNGDLISTVNNRLFWHPGAGMSPHSQCAPGLASIEQLVAVHLQLLEDLGLQAVAPKPRDVLAESREQHVKTTKLMIERGFLRRAADGTYRRTTWGALYTMRNVWPIGFFWSWSQDRLCRRRLAKRGFPRKFRRAPLGRKAEPSELGWIHASHDGSDARRAEGDIAEGELLTDEVAPVDTTLPIARPSPSMWQ